MPCDSIMLFCSSFTPVSSHRLHHSLKTRRPRATRVLSGQKRRVRTLEMNTIDGGSIPDWSDENPADVEFFDRAASVGADPPRASELPLFPLQMVLNPGTPVPLLIFELKYRLLFNRIRDGDSRFGIVLRDPETSALACVGCAAELTKFKPLPDGRIMTDNVGRERFRIVRIIEDKPYTRAMVEYLSDDSPQDNLSALMEEVWQILEDVLGLSNKLYDKVLDLSPEIKRLGPSGDVDSESESKDEVPEGWPSPKRLEDFSFAVCQVLDMPLKEQQILLQIQDTAARLRRQSKMLQTARQYLAAQVSIKQAGLGKW